MWCRIGVERETGLDRSLVLFFEMADIWFALNRDPMPVGAVHPESGKQLTTRRDHKQSGQQNPTIVVFQWGHAFSSLSRQARRNGGVQRGLRVLS